MKRIRIVAPLLVAVLAAAGPALAQHGHGAHPPMPDQKPYLSCVISAGTEPFRQDVPLEVPMTSAPAEMKQIVKLPEPLPSLAVLRYLPSARLVQNVVPGEAGAGEPSILVSIDGPKQHYRRWMIADDAERNRLISVIGTWRYMAVGNREERDDLYTQFVEEYSRDPVLRVSGPGEEDVTEIPAAAGTKAEIEKLGCTVRVVKFFPHFGIDKEKNEPVNVSDRRQNPAVLVEMTKDGKVSSRWVFAKFPDFAFHEEAELPFPVVLDCPQEKQGTTPDFAVVTIGRKEHEVWVRFRDETTSRAISTDEPVEVVGSQYEFHIAGFVPAGVLSENYERADGMGTVSVIQVEATYPENGKRESLWLELTKEKFLPTPRGPMALLFHLSAAAGPGQAHGAHQ